MRKRILIIVIIMVIAINAIMFSSCISQDNSYNNSIPAIKDTSKGDDSSKNDIPSGDSSDLDNNEQSDSSNQPLIEAVLSKQSLKCTNGTTLSYWLYTPENPTDNLPLLVYLHGGSGKGDDLDIVTQNGFPMYLKEGKLGEIPAYIVIPQLSSTMKGWTGIKGLVKELISYCENTYSVDTNRISLTGHSLGGTGTWSLALAYPTLFSCIAPLSGSITTNDDNLNALSQMPIWAFVGLLDTIVKPESSQDFISALKSLNISAKITTFEDATHFDIPELTYLDTDINIVHWLISNSKN